MSDVGIRLTMTENASSIAPKISESLRGISQAGEDMKEALELGDLEEKYKSFADRVDKLHDVQKEGERITSQQALAGRARGAQAPIGRAPEEIMKTTAGAVQRVGGTGDVTEAGPGILEQLKKMLSAAGPVGMAAGAVVGVTAAGALIANALAKQFEKVMPEMMDLTAIMGELGSTSKETSDSFKATMEEASGAASRFGYSLEVGAGVMRTFAEVAGVGRGEAAAGAGRVMEYARGMGISPGALGRAGALGARFGQQETLGYAYGGLQAAGMGKGQYQEFLNATLNIFEEGLSRGIVKAIPEIATTQAWIGQMGEQYQGQYGLNLYKKMEGTMAGATGLQAEKDVVLYRAAQRALGGEAGELEVMKSLERGPNQSFMKAVGEIVKETTGGVMIDSVRMLKSIFGVGYTQASDLAELLKSGKFMEAVKIVEPPDAVSREKDLLTAQEDMRENIRIVGAEIVPMKVAMVESAGTLVEILKNIAVEDEEEKIRRETRETEAMAEVLERAPRMRGRGGGPGAAEDIAERSRIGEETIDSDMKDLTEAVRENTKSVQDLDEEMKKGTEFEVVPPGM